MIFIYCYFSFLHMFSFLIFSSAAYFFLNILLLSLHYHILVTVLIFPHDLLSFAKLYPVYDYIICSSLLYFNFLLVN